jgi:uncharacterized protein YqjF (DUF2071 family)
MQVQKDKFLIAEWRKLLIANYPIDPALLQPYLPKGTELDYYNGICYISLVGFMFLETAVLGFGIPFHKNFEECNLRFYVKRKTSEGWRRGVVFIKEIVPKPLIALTAKTVYREPYVSMPMRHEILHSENNLSVAYYFQHKNFWNKMIVNAEINPVSFSKDSEEDFITEHYWGYNRFSENITMEYEVEHPAWKMYPVKDFSINIKVEEVYGKEFVSTLRTRPLSVMLAEGSEICVRKGDRMIF